MERLVGVELEFADLSPRRAAELVQELFGGNLHQQGTHDLQVTVEGLGKFHVTLDTRFADHGQSKSKLEEDVLTLVGNIGSVLLPSEVSTPPLPVSQLDLADRLARCLREAGASGTREGLLYAFGTHLNAELKDRSPAAIVRLLRAFSLSYAWLAAGIRVDFTRRLLRFAEPYPEAYVRLVVRPDYQPDTDRLIDDYLLHNPTRSRALDLLPLLTDLAAERVRRALPEEKIKPRPAIHYRLPNADFDDPTWSVGAEWRRWLAVETLASDSVASDELGQRFLSGKEPADSAEWLAISKPVLDRCLGR